MSFLDLNIFGPQEYGIDSCKFSRLGIVRVPEVRRPQQGLEVLIAENRKYEPR